MFIRKGLDALDSFYRLRARPSTSKSSTLGNRQLGLGVVTRSPSRRRLPKPVTRRHLTWPGGGNSPTEIKLLIKGKLMEPTFTGVIT